jgi:hypothetical protein
MATAECPVVSSLLMSVALSIVSSARRAPVNKASSANQNATFTLSTFGTLTRGEYRRCKGRAEFVGFEGAAFRIIFIHSHMREWINP